VNSPALRDETHGSVPLSPRAGRGEGGEGWAPFPGALPPATHFTPLRGSGNSLSLPPRATLRPRAGPLPKPGASRAVAGFALPVRPTCEPDLLYQVHFVIGHFVGARGLG
jgi:hypothetical protein